MAARVAPFGGGDGGIVTGVGFAKMQGEDFHYIMQKYSILLGRGSSRAAAANQLDIDLAQVGGSMFISRVHARIYDDFPRRRFALEVLGKNGCFVESVQHRRGCPPVKLDSQDLLQIGNKKFYFLLPVRSIISGHYAPRRGPHAAPTPSPRQMQITTLMPRPPVTAEVPGIPHDPTSKVKDNDKEDDGDDGVDQEEDKKDDTEEDGVAGVITRQAAGVGSGKAGSSRQQPSDKEKKAEKRLSTNKEENRERPGILEEKEVTWHRMLQGEALSHISGLAKQ